MASVRSVAFNAINLVNQSATGAVVAVRTTSVQANRTQNCSGTVDLTRATSWLLDHISISCV
jgi:hypothetical protein